MVNGMETGNRNLPGNLVTAEALRFKRNAEEGLRRFGIDESSIFRVTDAFMTLCSAKTLAAMLARRKAGSMRG